ncbi:hypothetical protein CcCBS67573_g04259 [Chytriomyces confervae]|uniref:AB hydrolase-1 domain-containing protein n=1 Tax=Chytriomyces confervae TaxID=246404 RepID=A0A507FEB6_9FUNG|nr:hypothetical protein HDU80_010555 [Chytriomyces hyalinus]TPX74472.1 hypothetical protein CcCBS67573_g04259 [Chytriomyces confervae]
MSKHVHLRIPLDQNNEWVSATATFPADAESSSIEDGNGRLMSVICHGISAHKNNPRLLRLISESLPHASLRFDFRGCGDSAGPPVLKWLDYYECLADLTQVCQWLLKRNWKINAIIGHSMGSLVSILYILRNPTVPRHFINISGRFDVKAGLLKKVVRDQYISPESLAALLQQTSPSSDHPSVDRIKIKGWRGGRETNGNRLKGEHVPYEICIQDGLQVWQRLDEEIVKIAIVFPNTLSTLTVHGTLDETVPAADAVLFDRVLPNHTLVLVEEGNHNFTGAGHAEKSCCIIVDWLNARGSLLSKL